MPKNTEYLWSVFSPIQTEYGNLQRISASSVEMEKHGPVKTSYLDIFQRVELLIITKMVIIIVKTVFTNIQSFSVIFLL